MMNMLDVVVLLLNVYTNFMIWLCLYSGIYYIKIYSIHDRSFILKNLVFHGNWNMFENKEDTLGIIVSLISGL